MDKLSFAVVETKYGPSVELYINGANLIDLVRTVELPFATAEGSPEIAGAYSGIPKKFAFLPSKHLLGESARFNACGKDKQTLLVCECGEAGCWSLCAKIEVTDTEVIWSDFSNNHRPKLPFNTRVWSYEFFGPFHFDKWQYINVLTNGAE